MQIALPHLVRKHLITLPQVQADWWAETAKSCGLIVWQIGEQVCVKGRQEDLDAAWQLWHEIVAAAQTK